MLQFYMLLHFVVVVGGKAVVYMYLLSQILFNFLIFIISQ
jgi:hypothetical protein